MMEALSSSETSVLKRATLRNTPKYAILQIVILITVARRGPTAPTSVSRLLLYSFCMIGLITNVRFQPTAFI
jgi:hypothetical protein